MNRLQSQIVSTIGHLQKDTLDPDLIMHKDCVPYKPFTQKARALALASDTCSPAK